MKKVMSRQGLTFAGIALSAIMLCSSCKKDNENIPAASEQETAALEVEGVQCINGTLHFESSDAFFATTEMLAKSSPEERKAWEESVGFKSTDQSVNEVYTKLAETDSEGDYNLIVAENADIVHAENGGVEPNIPSLSYAAVANREGVFYVEGVTHVVKGEKIAMSVTKDAKTVSAALNSNLKTDDAGIDIESYVGETSLKSSDCGYSFYRESYSNDRKKRIKFYVECYAKTVTKSDGTKRAVAAVLSEVYSECKNWRGVYQPFENTRLKIYDFKFTVNVRTQILRMSPFRWEYGPYSYYSKSIDLITRDYDWKSLREEITVGPEYTKRIDVNFSKIYVKASSRGIGNNCAVINCGY